MLDPDYPHIILAFTYRNFEIKIASDRWQDNDFYTAWADYSFGSAVAVPYAVSTRIAVRQAKRWVDKRMES